eukprot:gene10974-7619_t
MGKLSISVHSCNLYQPVLDGRLHPRVTLLVDKRFTFHTKCRHGPCAVFDETFQVGNIHQFAEIQISVEHVQFRAGLITGLLTTGPGALLTEGGVGGGDGSGALRAAVSGAVGGGGGGGILGSSGGASSGVKVLLARCYLSVRRLADGVPRQRTFYLATVPHRDAPEHRNGRWNDPQGVAGTITLTLKVQDMGYDPQLVVFNDTKEERYHQTLARLLLRYDTYYLGRIDLLFSNAREPTEVRQRKTWAEIESQLFAERRSTKKSAGMDGKNQKARDGETATVMSTISDQMLKEPETFESIMAKLCERGGWNEPMRASAAVAVEGCSAINLSGLPRLVECYVVLRTPMECYTTTCQSLNSDPVLCHGDTVMDVIDPTNWTLLVVLMGKGPGGVVEIGRTVVSFGALSAEHASRRNVFLCSFENPLCPTIRGIAHFTIIPRRFGQIHVEHAKAVDKFYVRLSKYFRRYDVPRLSEVDALIQSRLLELEELMEDLVADYGLEPDSAKITVRVKQLSALRENFCAEMDRKVVRVRLTLGEVTVFTEPLEVRRYVDTEVNESYEFDIVRDTDLLQVDVVKAIDDQVVYGSALISFLNMQRSVVNYRREVLVANTGQMNAYVSGNVDLTLTSQFLGHDYEVDKRTERAFRGRLLRYLQRRLPSELHRTSVLVSTVFDMETFLANLSLKYGAEDPTYAIFFTVTGCRNMKFSLGNRPPLVVVRCGISSNTIRVKHEAGMDYFEYCQFYFDRLEDTDIFVVLVDHVEGRTSKAVAMGRVPLRDVLVERPYDDYVPLYDKKSRSVGSIGLKYVVRDLCLVDRTRVEVLARKKGIHTADVQDIHAMASHHIREPSVMTDDSGAVSGGRGTRLLGRLLKLPRRVLSAGRGEQAGNMAGPNAAGDQGSLHRALSNDSFNQGAPSTALSEGRISTLNRQAQQQHGGNAMDALVLDFDDFECSQLAQGRRGGGSEGPLLHSRTASLHREFETYVARLGATGEDMDTAETLLGIDHSISDSIDDFAPPSQMRSETTFLMQSSSVRNTHVPMARGFNTLGAFDIDSLPPAPPPPPPKVLHVKLFYCENLQSSPKQLPNPFVVLTTIRETLYSKTVENTNNPRYDEVFQFRLEHPEDTALRISVLTNTPLGTKKLGHCRRQGFTRRVALVVNSHTRGAFEQGSVCLSLMGEGFGIDIIPPADAQLRLRERVREFLEEEAREHLHRLEWFVDEYHMRESSLLGALKGKNSLRPSREELVPVEVRIHKVSQLFADGWQAIGRCMVRVSLEHKRVGKTKWLNNSLTHTDFTFNETIRVNVQDPRATFFTLEVAFNEKHKMVGECCIPCVAGHTHSGMLRHMLVLHAQTPEAQPAGYIIASVVHPKSKPNRRFSLLPIAAGAAGAASPLPGASLLASIRRVSVGSTPPNAEDTPPKKRDGTATTCKGDSRSGGRHKQAKSQSKRRRKHRSSNRQMMDGFGVGSGPLGSSRTSSTDSSTSTSCDSIQGEEDGEIPLHHSVPLFADLDAEAATTRTNNSAAHRRRSGDSASPALTTTTSNMHRHVAFSATERAGGDRRASRTKGWHEAPPEDEESQRYSRLVRYYSYYKRSDLAMVAVRYATITSVDTLIAKLESHYGPEPGDFEVEIAVQQCRGLQLPAGSKSHHAKARELGVLVRLGLQEFRTTRMMGIRDFVLPPTDICRLRVGLPTVDTVDMIVVEYKKNRMEELGRTRLLLHHVPCNSRKAFRQPLLFRGEQSNIAGSLYFTVFTTDFGQNVVEDEVSESLQALSLFQRSSTVLIQRAMENREDWGAHPAPPGNLWEHDRLQSEVARRIRSPGQGPGQVLLFPPSSPILANGVSVDVGAGSATPSVSQTNANLSASTTTAAPAPLPVGESVSISGGLASTNALTLGPLGTNHSGSAATLEGGGDQTADALEVSLGSLSGGQAVVTLDSFVGLRVDRDELRFKIFDERKNLLLKTKYFKSEQFRVIKESFRITELNCLPSASFSLVLSSPRMIGAVEISRCDFCLNRGAPNGYMQRQLRLYDNEDHHFLGLVILQIFFPPLPMTIVRELRPLTRDLLKAADEIVDEVSSLLGLCQPKMLHCVDLMVYRCSDIHRVHDNLRDHAVPKAAGTTFIGIREMELYEDMMGGGGMTEKSMGKRLYISAETPGADTDRSVVYTGGAPVSGVAKKHKLSIGLLRVDLVSPAVDRNPRANAVTLRVGLCRTPFRTAKGKELGRCVLSVRALLSSGVYPANAPVRVPLVRMTEGANEVEGKLIGSLVIMTIPLVYSRFNPQLYLSVPANFDRSIMEEYYERLWRFAERHDESLLLELHFMLFEEFLQSNQWRGKTSNFLRQSVVRYGAEPDKAQMEEARRARKLLREEEGGETRTRVFSDVCGRWFARKNSTTTTNNNKNNNNNSTTTNNNNSLLLVDHYLHCNSTTDETERDSSPPPTTHTEGKGTLYKKKKKKKTNQGNNKFYLFLYYFFLLLYLSHL